MIETITYTELLKRCDEQCVSTRADYAFRCVVCGTIQSGASLMRAGASKERAAALIGFSCEGRLTNAGPWPSERDRSKKAKERRKVRGCDWTLGGLFTIHKLAIDMEEDGDTKTIRPCFVLATPEEAQKLELWVATP